MEEKNEKPDVMTGTSETASASAPAVAKPVAADSRAEPIVPADDDGEASLVGRFASLPEPVRAYLHSDALSDVHERIYAKHGVEGDFADVAYMCELEVFVGNEDVELFFDMLWARCPWPDEDEEKAKAFAVDVLGNVFLPAQVFLGDVNAAIVELGGDPAAFDVEPLKVRELSYEEGAEKVLSLLGSEGIDAADTGRLRHIIESRLRDVRDDAETKHMLMKERKTGGLELPDAQADRIMAALAAEMRMTVFMEAAAFAERARAAEPRSARPAPGGAEAASGTAVASKTAPASRAARSASAADEWTPERIKAVYIGHPNEHRELLGRMEKLKGETGGDPAELRDRLYDALHPVESGASADRLGIVAALVSLAQNNGLIKTLIEDDRFSEVVSRYVRDGHADAAEAVRRAPGGRVAMNVFLQLLLKVAIDLDDNDSARYGLRIINTLKKMGETQYAGLVAFDTDAGGFRWTAPLDL